MAVKTTDGPVALLLSRQKLPVLGGDGSKDGLSKGAYVLSDSSEKPDMILIATGSEVHIALKARERLSREGVAVRVVSMPSWELFEKTGQEYKDQVLPPDVPARMAVEAGLAMGWRRYVGDDGMVIGITGFGASAPGGTVMEKFGFTTKNIVEKALVLLKK